MNLHHRFFITLSLVILFGLTPAMAESLELRTLVLDKKEISELYVKGSKGAVVLPFSSIQPSKLMLVTAMNPLLLYTKKLNDQGEVDYNVAYRVQIPSGAKGVLLLAWTSKEKKHFLAVNDHFSTAHPKEWLLINSSDKSIAFQVGANTKPALIKPKDIRIFKVQAKEGKGAPVLAKASIDGNIKTIYSTYWPMYLGKRLVVIITNQGKKIRVKPIFDQILTQEQKEQLKNESE